MTMSGSILNIGTSSPMGITGSNPGRKPPAICCHTARKSLPPSEPYCLDSGRPGGHALGVLSGPNDQPANNL